MNDTRTKLLLKVAANGKAPELIANVYTVHKLEKVAKQQALKKFTSDYTMNKKADLSQYLGDAWKGVQNWWANDANKAGLATGALAGLGTYGLTGLVPGLRKSRLARLGLALGAGFGGYKGGQWGANKLIQQGNVAGQEAQAKIDAQSAADRQAEWDSERGRLQTAIDAANARAAEQDAEIGGLKSDISGAKAALADEQKAHAATKDTMAETQKKLDQVTERNQALESTEAPTNLRYLEIGKAQEQRRRAEGQAIVNAEFNKKLTGFVQNLIKDGPIPADVAKTQIDALTARLTKTVDPEQQKLLENAIKLIQSNTAPAPAPVQTFTFGNE